jgi:UPF0755 protein
MLTVLKRLFVLGFALALGFAGWMAWFAANPLGLSGSPLEFSIRTGSGLRAATRQIIDAGVRMPGWQFTLLARANGADKRIKAGSYQLSEGVTPLQLLRKITDGDVAQAEVLFVEGWTFRQVRTVLNAHGDLKHDTLNLSDAQIMEKLGEAGLPAEGLFFPDTYLFGKGESDLAVLARARRAMEKRLQSAWLQRAPGLPVAQPYQALILASIVEKETGHAGDRDMVAAVLVNRLRQGMRLQVDPTVIYGMGEKFDGNLRRRDLETDTPFNTYMRTGLPPQPIAMPGLASLTAALNPANSDALYFVARGDGTSVFSRSLEEHNRAVTKFQKSGGR